MSAIAPMTHISSYVSVGRLNQVANDVPLWAACANKSFIRAQFGFTADLYSMSGCFLSATKKSIEPNKTCTVYGKDAVPIILEELASKAGVKVDDYDHVRKFAFLMTETQRAQVTDALKSCGASGTKDFDRFTQH